MTLSRTEGAQIVKLMLAGMLAFLLLIGYVFAQSYIGRHNLAKAEKTARIELAQSEKRARYALVNSQRAGCERAKLDRRANAEFQRAQSEYIRKVVLAQSVKEDVKRAARTARATFLRTSRGLLKRSKINCSEVFPKESS